ncbi:MAG: hypothetical protein Q4B73_09440 [Lachnospiraceae bacterium]|nr:hypothetical protein [Lachnospiraceae bacterium]
MDPVFDKLLHIERSAEKILKDAEKEKASLIQQHGREMDALDKACEEETRRQIEEQHALLKEDIARELSSLRENTDKAVAALQKSYDDNHADWAEAITARILS